MIAGVESGEGHGLRTLATMRAGAGRSADGGLQSRPAEFVKYSWGRQVEQARKRQGVTQQELAQAVDMSTRWLRELEAGNPQPNLDMHLRCIYQLGILPINVALPLLLLGSGARIVERQALDDLCELERICNEAVARHLIGAGRRAG